VTTKSISIKGANSKSGGCAGKAYELTSGDLLRVRLGTGRAERQSEHATEVSRGHSRREQSVHSIEALTRKGRNSRARRTGNDTHEGLNGAQLRRAGKWERQVGVGFYE
jgi:hypothetical protein